MNRVALLTMLRASRDWRPFVVVLVAVASVALWVGRSGSGLWSAIGFYGPVALAVSTIGGIFAYSQRGAVWLMLAQRSGTETRRLWTILGFAFGLYIASNAMLLAGAVGGLALNPTVPREVLLGHVVSLVLWALVVGCAVAVTSSVARNGTTALSVSWVFAPMAIGLLAESVGMPASVRHGVEFLMPPFNAVFGAGAVIRGESAELSPTYFAQLLTFPLLCLVLLYWRVRVLARPDQIRSE